jgi:N-acetylneuraminate synthase/N,N'-diacetyllegionaminate synthase
MQPFKIRDRHIGSSSRCFVIAEAGVNHNGDINLAHQLIDVAAYCGADAVKFQTFQPTALVSANAATAPYQRRQGLTQDGMLRALLLPNSAWRELAVHASERGLIFTSTPFDIASLEVLLDLEVQILKIPSGELTNLTFISHVAAQCIPVILSTGIGTLEEVEAAVAAASRAPNLALLHCVTAYPAPVESSNLRAIVTLSQRFQVPVGWSDHTRGHLTAVAALALGASILEKHITLDRNLDGPDHAASADPNEFEEYVEAVRAIEAGLGDGTKKPADVELENRQCARRSFHAARTLHPLDTIREDDVCLLRPATGLPPSTPIIGRTVCRQVPAGSPIVEQDLQ